jgi:dCTP deaminase
MEYGGALPSQFITDLIDQGFILGAQHENVRPGSLDLQITGEVYRVCGAFLPSCNETVFEAIQRAEGIKLAGENILLERGCCYALRLSEEIVSLPRNVYAYCNPKSSSGRVDIHVRLLADRVSRYDVVPKEYSGPLWILLVPKTFPVIVSPGLTLNQLRFFNQDTRLDELRLEINFSANGGMLFTPEGEMISYKDLKHSDRDGSILLSLGLNFDVPGFEAIEKGHPIDLSLKNHYDPRMFFREISFSGGGTSQKSISLKSGTFYILSTREHVRVSNSLACEMRPMDERSGDLRSHYAGFIDPGWGMGANGLGLGRPLTLEVRSFDSGIIICHGQPIAKIRYERMVELPREQYDQMSPTYGAQNGPKLGKYFTNW